MVNVLHVRRGLDVVSLLFCMLLKFHAVNREFL